MAEARVEAEMVEAMAVAATGVERVAVEMGVGSVVVAAGLP